jgi:fibronectin type 3 domain-containing protein
MNSKFLHGIVASAFFMSAAVAALLPGAPSRLTASAQGPSIRLSWAAVPGATSYTVKRSPSPDGIFMPLATGSSAATTYTDLPMVNATYYYTVTASNSDGEGPASAPATARETSAGTLPVYVFATFHGDHADQMKLWIYTSPDGIHYTMYSATDYGGPTGALRDPSIMKYSDGRYYIVFTAPPAGKPYAHQNFVALAWSTDLQTWHTMPNVSTTGVPGVKISWAPEWVVDGSAGLPKFIVNCSSASSDLRPYLYTATSRDLSSWSGPVDIGIGSTYLDSQVLKVGNTWHCFTKSSLARHATAPSITGPWTWLPDHADWKELEGPCAMQLIDGSWIMYVDPMHHAFQYMTGKDIDTWSQLHDLPGGGTAIDKNYKHGTAIRDDTFHLPPAGLTAKSDGTGVTLQWNAFSGASFYIVKRATTSGGPFTPIAKVTDPTYTDSHVTNGTTYYYEISMNYGGITSPDSLAVSITSGSN